MSNSNFRFLHIRRYIPTTDFYSNHIQTKGGKTICYRELDDGTIEYTVARCSARDNFCRKTGRSIALGRFQQSEQGERVNHRRVISKESRMKVEQTGEMTSPVDMLFLNEGL